MWFITSKIAHYPVTSLVSLLVILFLIAIVVIVVTEDKTFEEAVFMVMPAFVGELGQVEAESKFAPIVVLVGLLASVGFLAIITAKIASKFIEFSMKGGRVVKRTNVSDHIIICGWNFQGKNIVAALLSAGTKPRREIVILAKVDKCPTSEERAQFMSGDPTQDNDLVRAGVRRANSVIVLSDLSKGANEADAKALMIVLAVESLNQNVHTCVQIMNSSNRIHLERAHADDIICLDQMGGSLAVATALNHGISYLLLELLTFNSGSEFYRYDRHLSDKLVGKEFFEAAHMLAGHRMILLGIETDTSEELQRSLPDDILHSLRQEDKVILVNPQSQYKIQQGDALFLVAESGPTEL